MEKILVNDKYGRLPFSSKYIDISKRFDIYPKLLYARYSKLGFQTHLHSIVYYEHTKSLNNFLEFDNQEKNSFSKFKIAFDQLLKVASINEMFTEPIKTSGMNLINGLHRTAAALTYDRFINATTNSDKSEGRLLWPYAKSLILNESSENLQQLDADYLGLQEFVKYVPNAKVLILTPNCVNKEILEHTLQHNFLEKIIYKKSLLLTKAGYLNLNNQLYGKEEWTKTTKTKLADHTNYCVSNAKPNIDGFYEVDAYVMNLTNQEALDLKQTIREFHADPLSKSFKTSCHINDNSENDLTIDLVRSIFRKDSDVLLNTLKFQTYDTFKNHFAEVISSNSLSDISDCIMVSGGSAINMFVDRESKDVDIITTSTIKHKDYCRNRTNVDSYNYYGQDYLNYCEQPTFDEIVLNPNNYYYFFGLKFMNPNMLVRLKLNRYVKYREPKDKNDIETLGKVVKLLNKNK